MKNITLFFFLLLGLSLNAQSWTQFGQTLLGSSTSIFGYDVDMSEDGMTIIAGAPEGDYLTTNGGGIFVHEWDGSAWIIKGAPIYNGFSFANSGYSVAMNATGTRIVTGARFDADRGTAKAYEWNGTAWVQMGNTIIGEAIGDFFGNDVAMNDAGDVIVVGGQLNDAGSSGSNRGHARVYQWNGLDWVQLGSDIDGTNNNDRMGWSVATSADGMRIAVSAILSSPGGLVKVYDYNGTDWVQTGSTLMGIAGGDYFGYSVSLSDAGDVLAVGAFNGGSFNRGEASTYEWDGTSWSQIGQTLSGVGNNDNLGASVRLSSDASVLVVGKFTASTNSLNRNGGVEVYDFSGGNWVAKGSPIDGLFSDERVGFNVGVDQTGNRLVLAGIYYNSNQGRVAVYEFPLPNIWTGNTSIDWNVGSNWSKGTVPTATEETIIPTSPSGGVFPTTTSDITQVNLTIETGATLTIGPSYGLIIGSNGLITNNGLVILAADASGSAWLDDFTNANASYSGDVTVQQYISIGASLGQRLFGSPVNNGIVNGLDNTYVGGATGNIIMSNCSSGQSDVGTPYTNLFQWEENYDTPNDCYYEAWNAIDASLPLTDGRGYSGWMQQNSIISFSGTPTTGNVSYGPGLGNSNEGLAEKDGWHVLSNPYPSAINVQALTGAGWLNLQTYDASLAYAGTYQPILPGQDLAVGQGFIAFNNGATALNLTNAFRRQGSQGFKSNTTWFDAKLEVMVSNGSNADLTYVYFNNQATSAFDPSWDCEKKTSDAGIPTLYTLIEGKRSSLNGQALANMSANSIPLGLQPGSDNSFELSFNGIETFDESVLIFLEDKALGAWIDLREDATYTFQMDLTDNPDRFELHFTGPHVMSLSPETCEGNDAKIAINLGGNVIANNPIEWVSELYQNGLLMDSGSSATNLIWENLSPGNYTVKLTHNNYEVMTDLVVEDMPEVSAVFEVSSNEILLGEAIDLVNLSLGATNYEWTINNQSVQLGDLTHTFTSPGVHLIGLRASNNTCFDFYEEYISVLEKTTSVRDMDLAGVRCQLVENQLFVTQTQNPTTIELNIYDLLGKNHATHTINDDQTIIDLSQLTNGVYYVVLSTSDKSYTQSIWVRH